jgi:SAM-dependent methyltransferase
MEQSNNIGHNSRLPLSARLVSSLLRIFFHLLYHQFSWAYDPIAWMVSMGSWQKWVQAIVPYLNGPTVLEIGFGPGHLLASLDRTKLATFGLDESRQMLRSTQRRLKVYGYDPNLIRGDAQALPFSNECFNQVVMTFPAEFILKPATILEIQRVLVREGSALILPLAWITGRRPLERIMAWVNRIAGESPDWDPKVLEPLKTAGFDVSWNMIDFPNSKIVLVRLKKMVDRESRI